MQRNKIIYIYLKYKGGAGVYQGRVPPPNDTLHISDDGAMDVSHVHVDIKTIFSKIYVSACIHQEVQ